MASVAVVCDVGPTLGSGHSMRCLALAQELMERGHTVTYSADVASVPWVHRRVSEAGVDVVGTGGDLGSLATRLAVDAIVVDSYLLGPRGHQQLAANGCPVLALVDYDLRGAVADVVVDQNFGAELDRPVVPPGTLRLAGTSYALIRDDVLAERPPSAPGLQQREAPVVLGVFGGTDPGGAGPVLAQALAATRRPFRATFVTPRDDLAEAIRRLPLEAGQSIATIAPTDGFAALAASSDLVVSAAGSSTLELLCLGVCTAVVCVADNQRLGYERAVAHGLVGGLGDLRTGLRAGAVDHLTQLLDDAAARAQLARHGWEAVDGRGRRRVADVLLDTLART